MSKAFKPAPSLRERAKGFVAKLLSVKFVVFVVGTALLVFGKLSSEVWLGLVALVVGVRAIEKKPWQGDGA
jgi:hypothetical protein